MSASKKVSATNPTTKESRKRKTDGENDHMDLPAADAVATGGSTSSSSSTAAPKKKKAKVEPKQRYTWGRVIGEGLVGDWTSSKNKHKVKYDMNELALSFVGQDKSILFPKYGFPVDLEYTDDSLSVSLGVEEDKSYLSEFDKDLDKEGFNAAKKAAKKAASKEQTKRSNALKKDFKPWCFLAYQAEYPKPPPIPELTAEQLAENPDAKKKKAPKQKEPANLCPCSYEGTKINTRTLFKKVNMLAVRYCLIFYNTKPLYVFNFFFFFFCILLPIYLTERNKLRKSYHLYCYSVNA